ncbi:kynureninase [Lutimonas saemankumensis]|uniref:kynureninase n=1 Tax=Lutimonas saemankumensis TaxID=483016 RepID=UPI001CD4EE01|nr:kynureninase [Lutimonas saemankumensis]MCA0933424.1 kynureninase [Lutimonas saemankumensis]
MKYQNNIEFALRMDQEDPLADYRHQFYFPKHDDGKETIYLCGNSLGLQPKTAESYIKAVLDDWKHLGVKGHFEGENPFATYHEDLGKKMASIVGAKKEEVVAMNSLTVNLHLMMVTFYRPEGKRRKIVIEKNAFPSDQYAVKSQLEFHGYDPDETLIEIEPREGEDVLRTEDITDLIIREGNEIALIMLSGLNYYTGQAYDMKAITKAGHHMGCQVGFDLAHGAGNLKLSLHDWGVDFAVWCTYKYMNSGPGGIAGCFVHSKHVSNKDLPRFTGWWGNKKETRFLMDDTFDPIEGAEGWQMSNETVLSMAALKASLEIFDQVGMDKLVEKSKKLTGYLEFLIDELKSDRIQVITPRDPEARGAQLSIRVLNSDKSLFKAISEKGVIADWREPDVIRIAPAPVYNNFNDVYRFVEILKGLVV